MRNKILVMALILMIFLLANQYDRSVFKTYRQASNEAALQYID